MDLTQSPFFTVGDGNGAGSSQNFRYIWGRTVWPGPPNSQHPNIIFPRLETPNLVSMNPADFSLAPIPPFITTSLNAGPPPHVLEAMKEHNAKVAALSKTNSDSATPTEVSTGPVGPIPKLVVRIPKSVTEAAALVKQKSTKPEVKRKKAVKRISTPETNRLLSKGSSTDMSASIIDRASELLRTSTSEISSTDTDMVDTEKGEPSKSTTAQDLHEIMLVEEIESSLAHKGRYTVIKREPMDTACPESEYQAALSREQREEYHEPRASVINLPARIETAEEKVAAWLGRHKPDEKNRISMARHLLVTPEHSVLWIFKEQSSQMPNEIGSIVEEIHEKIRNKHSITETEYQVITEYNGFLTSKIAEKFARSELSKATCTRQMGSELANEASHGMYPCQVRSTQRSMELLDLDPSWRQKVKAVMVGFIDLVYQPDDTKHIVVNLSEEKAPEYKVRQDYENISIEEITNSPLYQVLKKKLEFIGMSGSLPVFIEYTPYPISEFWNTEETIGSFLKVIQFLQQKYHGPLLVTTTSPTYLGGETMNSYVERKGKVIRATRIIHCLGQALGVGTVFLWIASIHCASGFYLPDGARRYPLFSPKGNITFEYNNRFKLKLKTLIEMLDKKFTTNEEKLDALK